VAINKAQSHVKQTGDLPIPLSLRNAPTKLMKELDYGKGYKYAHDYPNNFAQQEFLPGEISNSLYYDPTDNPTEQKIRERLKSLWKDKYSY
jgi:putative ATPase